MKNIRQKIAEVSEEVTDGLVLIRIEEIEKLMWRWGHERFIAGMNHARDYVQEE